MFLVLLHGGDTITHADGKVGKKSISLSVHTREVSLCTCAGPLLFFIRVVVCLSRESLIENLLSESPLLHLKCSSGDGAWR